MTGLEQAICIVYKDKDYRKFRDLFAKWIQATKEEIQHNTVAPPKHSIFNVIEKMDRIRENEIEASFVAGLNAIVGKQKKKKRPSRRGNVNHFNTKPETGYL